ncbi:type IV toxin-antitoxin system AbiEi family antitoxin [Stakelama sediminis]|nr:type IV toxin-antitoxin system AbiEi family antitoxin [Stakelama sediminis]
MSISRSEKIKSLMDQWRPHTVVTSVRLNELGISPQDTQNYLSSRWLEPLGRGAYKRPVETVTWQGALWTIQTQLKLDVHVAARTALEMTGKAHYLRFAEQTVFLFSPPKVALPAWFKTYDWSVDIRHTQTKFLPPDLGLADLEAVEGFKLRASSPERAILETLHLTPQAVDLVEAAQLTEGLVTLRPKLMQELLEACNSVKVKRLFLYLAERADLPVTRHLNPDVIDLGTGDRSLVPKGKYVAKYGLLLPSELVNPDA